MLVETPEIRSRLHGIVSRLAPPPFREDLMQEAMLHLWRTEEQDPGKDEMWYLQGCRLHLQNLVRLGRSVDSLKHLQFRVLRWQEPVDGIEPPQPVEPVEPVWDEVSVNDFMAELLHWLTPQATDTLLCLMDGLSARETAKQLNISHTMVNRHRSRIANLALKLGMAPTQRRKNPVRRKSAKGAAPADSASNIP